MVISNLNIKNFKGYTEFSIQLNPKFNMIVGNNGSGKTAILEALAVAVGSFFLGIKNTNTRGIHNDEIHISSTELSEEYLFPVVISAKGIINDENINWSRELNGVRNRTTTVNAEKIKSIALQLDNMVRLGEKVNLPIILYYSTGRLFDQARKNDKGNSKKEVLSSRFRAYERCLDSKSTYSQFEEWYKGKELARLQKGKEDFALEVVKNAIVNPDKVRGLRIIFNDNRNLPFQSLSDGTRNFFAIIADISYKCLVLNPHLEHQAIEHTKGIILIDELDLHLHPDWQKRIVISLKETFPLIQFIVTTHSPFLIQEAGKDELIILNNSKVDKITSGVNLSIEDIAEEIQMVENPQWSKKRQKMYHTARKYYQAMKKGKDTQQMKDDLDEAMKPFANDTALYSILEQRKLIEKYKKKSN